MTPGLAGLFKRPFQFFCPKIGFLPFFVVEEPNKVIYFFIKLKHVVNDPFRSHMGIK